MLNERELEKLKEIKERSGFESCAGYSSLSVEEARWLISLLERTQCEAEGRNVKLEKARADAVFT